MTKGIIALGVIGFILIYFVLVPYLLWTAPMEDDYEEEDIRRAHGIYSDDDNTDDGEGDNRDQHGTM